MEINYTGLMIRTLIAVINACLLIGACGCTAKASEERKTSSAVSSQPNSQNIFFGPAVILLSTYVRLYGKQNGEIYARDRDFGLVKQWLMQNVFDTLNQTRKISTTESECWILLSRVDKRSMDDVLLIIPLNSEVLGDDYSHKIDQLKSLLRQRRSSRQSKSFNHFDSGG